MGCVFTRELTEDNNPRMFKVINVDDQGLERNPGHIEITESELVWYQRGKEPIKWPLKSLRRYGFDAELFSFESGRRCPTGPGIYAFKCRRAEALFNLLQESIQRQRTGQDDSGVAVPSAVVSVPTVQQSGALLRPNSTLSPGMTTASRPNSVELDNVTNGSAPLYVNSDVQAHEYINTEINPSSSRQNSLGDPTAVTLIVPPAATGEHVIQYAELDLPKSEDGNIAESTPTHNGHGPPNGDGVQLNASSQQAMYVNVPANEIKKAALGAVGGCPVGITVGNGITLNSNNPRGYSNVVKPPPVTTNGPKAKVNYIQIDHGDNSEGGAVGNQSPLLITKTPLAHPESPTRKTDTYARIDIKRTQALNSRGHSSDDEGSRKTRHNSNIEELYGDNNG